MGKKIEFAAKPKKAKQVPEVADTWVSGGEPKEKQAAEKKPKIVMKRLTMDIPMDLHQRIKIGSAKRGISMVKEIRRLLDKEFPK